MQILIGCTLALGISWGAWKAHALTKNGMWAAAALGGIIFNAGHLPWSIPILGFFLSSSLWSRLQAITNPERHSVQEKRQPRDWGQVLANGGVGAILAVISCLRSPWDWPAIAYAGAMAAVTADTWATEFGALSTLKPRLITSWKVVEPGTSGGITTLGTLSSIAGSLFMAWIAILVFRFLPAGRVILVVSIAGWMGSFFDSLLGTTLQATYFCPSCQKETEHHPLHRCQTPTVYQRGLPWLNNDGVNFLSSVMGSVVSTSLWILFSF
jgi:uncharacterized protein (TIGR00297 family)